MMKKDLDMIMGQLDEIGEKVRAYQSMDTLGAKKVQTVLLKAFIDIDKIVREK